MVVTMRELLAHLEGLGVHGDVVTEEYRLPAHIVGGLQKGHVNRRISHIEAMGDAGCLEFHGLGAELEFAPLIGSCHRSIKFVLLAALDDPLEAVFSPFVVLVTDADFGFLGFQVFDDEINHQQSLIHPVIGQPEEVFLGGVEHAARPGIGRDDGDFFLFDVGEDGRAGAASVDVDQHEDPVLGHQLGKG